MSTKFPGGFITKNYTPPTTSSASGIWTLDQQDQAQQAGIWPFGGPFNYIEDVFSTWLYTGTGASQTITNGIDLSTNGGLVWFKDRSRSYSNGVFDSARGITKLLYTNTTATNVTTSDTVTSFNTNGFSIGTDSGWGGANGNVGDNYVSWTFRKQPKFFDVQTYTGNGGVQNIAHNLGSVPGCIIVKNLTTAYDWRVYHRSLANTQDIFLNLSDAVETNTAVWNSTTPTSTVFTVGNTGGVNASGDSFVAYVFAHNAGGFGLTGTDNVITCGSVTLGSGVTTINLGYEPQWIMFKSSTSVQNWQMVDSMRGLSQTGYQRLFPNTTGAEGTVTSPYIVQTSTGFTMDGSNFGSGDTFIYIAIRRGPMKVPTDATKVFSPIASSDTQGTQQTTGFPVDLQLAAYRPGNANNTTANDRLRGVSTTSTGNTSTPLVTSSTAAETAGGIGTQGWNNTGFGIPAFLSISSSIYWNFKRAPSFFDEVCYTGNGSTQNINHNLQVIPELVIFKDRSTSVNWRVSFSFTDTDNANAVLNTTATQYVPAYGTFIFNSKPTSTILPLYNYSQTNGSGDKYVAYLFATCAGVSKVGTYIGNGTTQAIACGFTGGARFVLIKQTDGSSDWYVWDTARGMTTLTDPYLTLDTTNAETATLGAVTSTTGGFSLNSTIFNTVNSNGSSYLFLAIA